MKIIFLNMSSQFEWDRGIYNRNKYILDEISKRDDVEDVLSVDFLPYTLRGAIRLYVKSKLYKKIGKGIISSGPFYVARRLNKKIISLSAINMLLVKIVAKNLGFNDAIVINYNPLNTKYFKYFKDNKKYFDAVDDWSENKTFEKEKELLLENYKNIIQNSEYTFTRPEKLKDKFIKIAYCHKETETTLSCNNIKDNIKIILNGVDVDHYKNPKNVGRLIEIFEKIDKDFKIKIGYVGVIKEDRIDSDLLEYLLNEHKDKMFVMGGIIGKTFNIQRFENYKNIIFLGELSYDEMSAIYKNINICIIPHLLNEFIKSMDPMKLYGYLAAGKPVVTVDVPGVEQFKDLIKVTNSKEQFSSYINEIANSSEYYSNENILERQESIKEFSWKGKADEMMKIINS